MSIVSLSKVTKIGKCEWCDKPLEGNLATDLTVRDSHSQPHHFCCENCGVELLAELWREERQAQAELTVALKSEPPEVSSGGVR